MRSREEGMMGVGHSGYGVDLIVLVWTQATGFLNLHQLVKEGSESYKKIVAELEKSEKTSKVYKQNAGAAQENVKHPKALIDKLNHAVIPEYAKLLATLHENSELTRLIKQK